MHCFLFQQNLLRHHILERLQTKLQYVISHPDLDLDYLNFMCTHELILADALAEQIELPLDVGDGLRELCCLVRRNMENEQHIPSVEIQAVQGARGRPKLIIEQEKLQALIDSQLPIPCIATLL